MFTIYQKKYSKNSHKKNIKICDCLFYRRFCSFRIHYNFWWIIIFKGKWSKCFLMMIFHAAKFESFTLITRSVTLNSLWAFIQRKRNKIMLRVRFSLFTNHFTVVIFSYYVPLVAWKALIYIFLFLFFHFSRWILKMSLLRCER